MKAEIRLMKEELSAIERYRTPKERSLAQCTSSLEAMRATKDGLESELHQELMAQLSVADQHQVCMSKDYNLIRLYFYKNSCAIFIIISIIKCVYLLL